MEKQKQLTDDDLLLIIKAHRRDAIGPNNKEVTQERAKALDHFHGRPYGNEEDDSSSVVTRDLSEAVDWAMPALLKMFLQSGTLAEFDPVGPEDDGLAKQESQAVNQVIMKDNNGFIVLNDTIWDALVLKNGYVKHWFDESEKIVERKYKDVSELEIVSIFGALEARGYYDIEVKDQEEIDEHGKPVERDEDETFIDALGVERKYNVTLKYKKKCKKIKIEAVPTEELLVSNRCRGSLQDSPYVEHIPVMTRSDLIEMGMDKEFVYDLNKKGGQGTSQANDTPNQTREANARDTVSDESDNLGLPVDDMSMDEIDYREVYLKVDYDRDGIAELRKIVICDNKIPSGDDWNHAVDCIPFTGGVAKRIPHRHLGQSLDDHMGDLQLIHTTLMRQMLDNIYHTNHIQTAVSNKVNKVDQYTNAPGGVKRVNIDTPEVAGHIHVLPVPSIIGQILPAIDRVTAMRDSRTGINEMSTNVSPDVLRDTTKGAFLEGLSRATQKIEMIGRMLGETLVRELVLRVHELMIKHYDEEYRIRLSGTSIPVNPMEWEDRTDLTVKVGLGTGTGEEKAQKLTLLTGLMEKIGDHFPGMVGPDQGYALFNDVAHALGADAPEKYIVDPKTPQFAENKQYVMGLAAQKEQQGNPLAEAEQVKGQYKLQSEKQRIEYESQIEMIRMQAEGQRKAMEAQQKAEIEIIKAELNESNARAERASREAIEAAKLEFQAWLEGIRFDIGQPGIGAGLQNGE